MWGYECVGMGKSEEEMGGDLEKVEEKRIGGVRVGG